MEKMKSELNLSRSRKSLTSSGAINVGSLSSENAEQLDMDHVYLTFSQILWGYT